MTVYTTMQGGDAVRIPAAVFSEEQSCGSAAKKRRRSPSPRARRRPAATRALPAQKGAGRRAAASRAESGVHQGTLSKARRAEQNHLPRSRAALPAHLASLTRGMSSSQETTAPRARSREQWLRTGKRASRASARAGDEMHRQAGCCSGGTGSSHRLRRCRWHRSCRARAGYARNTRAPLAGAAG